MGDLLSRRSPSGSHREVCQTRTVPDQQFHQLENRCG